jgi:hypothetical protein
MDSESILLKPTFYALAISGLLILTIIILMIINYKKIFKSQIVSIIFMLAIIGNLIANHGNLHHILERDYNYNPIKYTYMRYI